MREWRNSSSILNLRFKWRWMVSFTPLPFYLWGKGPQYLLDRRLGGLQCRSGRCGEDRKLTLAENRTSILRPSRPPLVLYQLNSIQKIKSVAQCNSNFTHHSTNKFLISSYFNSCELHLFCDIGRIGVSWGMSLLTSHSIIGKSFTELVGDDEEDRLRIFWFL
jgi:hypothetical protein